MEMTALPLRKWLTHGQGSISFALRIVLSSFFLTKVVARAEVAGADTTSEEAGVQRGEDSTSWREAEMQGCVRENQRQWLLLQAMPILSSSFQEAWLA